MRSAPAVNRTRHEGSVTCTTARGTARPFRLHEAVCGYLAVQKETNHNASMGYCREGILTERSS